MSGQIMQIRGPQNPPALSRPVPRIRLPATGGGGGYAAPYVPPVSRYRSFIFAGFMCACVAAAAYWFASAQTAHLLYEQEKAHAAALAEARDAAEARADAAEAALMASETVGRGLSAASDGIDEIRAVIQSSPWIVQYGSIFAMAIVALVGIGAALRSPLGSGIVPIFLIGGLIFVAYAL